MGALLAYAMRDASASTRQRPRTSGPAGRPGPRRHRRTFAENTWTGQQIIAGHAPRPAPDENFRPDLVDVEIPDGRRPVFDPDEAVAMLQAHPGNAALRVDSYVTRMAVCAALGRFVSEDAMAVASHDIIAQRASVYAGYRIARSTAGYHVRALEDSGAVILAFRGLSAAVAGCNLASVYVVTAPADTLPPREQAALAELAARLDDASTPAGPPDDREVDVEDEPGLLPVDELRHHPFREDFDLEAPAAQARIPGHFSCSETFTEPFTPGHGSKPAPMIWGTHPRHPRTLLGGEAPTTPQRREHPQEYAARTSAERRIAVSWLVHRLGWVFHDRTERELLVICAPFFRASWSALAIEHALLYQRDGTEHRGPLPGPRTRDRAQQPRIRNLWAVLTARLAPWRTEDGVPVAPPVATRQPRRGRPPGAVTRRRQLAEQAQDLTTNDPRRLIALATLRGEPLSVSYRPRSDQATAQVAAVRTQLAREATARAQRRR